MRWAGSAIVFLFMVAAAAVAVAQRTPSAAPDLSTIVSRLEQASVENRARFRPYTVTRDYRFYGKDPEHPDSEVVAEISFLPPETKTFSIKQATGSSRGVKVVRDILEGESKNAPHPEHTALTTANYDFRYIETDNLDGHPCYVLQLVPKRRETDLVSGRVWIDAQTYLQRRVIGDLSKTPSWWLKAVHITMNFGDVSGMWLQTETKASAEVRLFGEHVLEAHALNFATAQTLAQKTAIPIRRKAPARPTRTVPLAGAAVLIRR